MTIKTVGYALSISPDLIRPNPWNPNTMDQAMYERERASLREFGFVLPIMVRVIDEETYEIIDGEHRWRLAREEGMEEIPCWSLGTISDRAAEKLTLVLREVRGEHDPVRVQAILRDLVKDESAEQMRAVLPYSDEVFSKLDALNSTFDWKAFEQQAGQKPKPEPKAEKPKWVERIYRLPLEAAECLDLALGSAREEAGTDIADWQAIEMIARRFYSGA